MRYQWGPESGHLITALDRGHPCPGPSSDGGSPRGDAFDSSRILLATDWANLAQRLSGRLLVAVPANDTVLYAEENGTQSIRALASLARDSAAKAEHMVSAALDAERLAEGPRALKAYRRVESSGRRFLRLPRQKGGTSLPRPACFWRALLS